MENVSTGVLDKNKELCITSKDKAKKSYDVLRHIQLHMSKYKKVEDLQSIMSNLQPNCCLKVDLREVDKHTAGQWLIGCKAWNSPAQYPSWVARCDTKGSDGTMLNPIFWKKVQGQKHPGRWEMAERQIPNVKIYKTNTKGHKHARIRLFIIEQDTVVKPKKNKKWHSTQEPGTHHNSPIDCDGVQLHEYWTTLLVYVYIRPIIELV